MENINNKTFIGVYYNDSDLLDKIEELKLTGYLDDNIYVIAKNETDISMLRSRTAADVHAAYESWGDRFMSFLTGENHVRRMMHDVGMEEDEINRYYEEVQHGGMLLYVDEGWAFSVYSKDEPYYTDPLSASSSKETANPSRTRDPLLEEDVKDRARSFEEAEPSYGGYEPLKNPVPPEVIAADSNDIIRDEDDTKFIVDDEIQIGEDEIQTDPLTDSVLDHPTIDKEDKPVPRD